MKISSLSRLCFALSLSLAAPLVFSGCGSGPAEVPTTYVAFTASDNSFSGNGPAGWEKQAGDMGGTVGKVAFTSGGARILITSDSASSFLGDAVKMGQKPPVEVVHENGLNGLQRDFGDFSPMAMQTVTSPIGPARYSEWTGGGMHGYRATMLGPQRAILIDCRCPEAEWAALKPAFFKVFTDLKAGNS